MGLPYNAVLAMDFPNVALSPRRLYLAARNRSRGDARARRGPWTRRRYHLDRDGAGGRAGPRRRRCAQAGCDRRPAAGGDGIPPAVAADRDRAARPRRHDGQARDRLDDDFRQRPRHPVRRAHRAEFPRPPLRHRHRHGRIRAAHRPYQGARHLHAQDHARAAGAGEIRRALRRRLQSPLRAR